MSSLEVVQRGLELAGQRHVLQFWPELNEEDRERFLQELALLDLDGLRAHCERAAAAAASPPASVERHIEPVPPELIGSVKKSDRESLSAWGEEGEGPLRSSISEEEQQHGVRTAGTQLDT